MANNTKFQRQLDEIKSVAELMQFFEIEYESHFMEVHETELFKRFSGNVILTQPDDWFSYRRCLKNAYCRIQRSLQPKGGRSACRGCTSCERR
ncbi:nitrogen fixation protein NifW [Psychromonas sp. RZ22]|uniref:nitrogenase-stabilizing/protective protein NifW n=1 Tax=Psychromonas algarum TaxID=2555643 RepID=UPI001067CCEC|nr:nitrogenase-stabilizing/protective protein NifW [Psychromonas sp. RZ22]TEW53971.1 nitrogen fixation protein NifW [Psychromonas sp. RZ22]